MHDRCTAAPRCQQFKGQSLLMPMENDVGGTISDCIMDPFAALDGPTNNTHTGSAWQTR